MTTEEYNEKIKEYESELTGDMFQDMEIRDKIHNLKLQRDHIKPTTQEIDCVGCGS